MGASIVTIDTYIMAAVFAVVGKEKMDELSALQISGIDDIPENIDEALSMLKEQNALSDNQTVALYSYLYLYVQLVGQEGINERLEAVRQALSVPCGITKNLELIITLDRVQYIVNDYSKSGKNSLEIFCEPEDYIANMIVDVTAAPIQKEKTVLEGLQSSEYEHPTDRAALEKLRVNKVLEQILKWYSEYNVERLTTVRYTGSCVLVTEKNLPYCRILDVAPMPPLYLKQGFIEANTIGSSKPIVCLTASSLSLLSYEELLFILGHEVGHIKSQHVLYRDLGEMLPYIGDVIGSLTLGIGGWISSGIELALYNWFRKSEFTADRAGLLACQNPEAAISVMSKLAGFPPKYYAAMNNQHFLDQAVEFESLDNSKYNKVMKVLSAMYQDHPWAVMRAQELNKWVEQGEYERVLKKQGRKALDSAGQMDLPTTGQNTAFCSNCGCLILRSDKFCKQCGAPNLDDDTI